MMSICCPYKFVISYTQLPHKIRPKLVKTHFPPSCSGGRKDNELVYMICNLLICTEAPLRQWRHSYKPLHRLKTQIELTSSHKVWYSAATASQWSLGARPFAAAARAIFSPCSSVPVIKTTSRPCNLCKPVTPDEWVQIPHLQETTENNLESIHA